MRVCLLTDQPDDPVLSALGQLLRRRYAVEVLDPDADGTFLAELTDPRGFADVYLLNSRSRRCLALARVLCRRGGRVVNDPAATELCQDRVRMAELARGAGLPFAFTLAFGRLSGFLAYAGHLARTTGFRFPVVVKSHRSRRHDLVTKVNDLAQLRKLTTDWADEPVVVQQFIPNDGWDHKLLVIGTQVFAGLRRKPLDTGGSMTTRPVAPEELPLGWRELAREIGTIFNLQIYGVDVLRAGYQPVIVDINAFPGAGAVPGAPDALAALVRGVCAETWSRTAPDIAPDTTRSYDSWPGRQESPVRQATIPVATLHAAVQGLITAFREVAAGIDGRRRGPAAVPRAGMLSLKPGRGLVTTYRLVPEGRRRARAPEQLVTVTLSEQILASPRLPELLASVDPAQFQGAWPGRVSCPGIGMIMQAFPTDGDLPGLAAAFAPTPGSRLAEVLIASCRLVTGEPDLCVDGIRALLQRYNPGSRCVIRYEITASTRRGRRDLVLFGKMYRDATAAIAAHQLSERLWQVRSRGTPRAFVARPVALLEELSLALTEAADGAHDRERTDGALVLRPRPGPGAGIDSAGLPEDALRATAAALSWLHTSAVGDCLAESASGTRYLARANGWTAAIMRQVPSLAGEFIRVFRRIEAALSETTVDRPRPIHGAFKPPQLVFCGADHPVMTDFDSACLGDPALDVGYFLAYLRPPGLWRGRRPPRVWFSSARRVFLDAYRRSMLTHGACRSEVEGIDHRANVFEAVAILKIVSRRARHVNSPRAGELKAALAEIRECLRRFAGGTGTPE